MLKDQETSFSNSLSINTNQSQNETTPLKPTNNNKSLFNNDPSNQNSSRSSSFDVSGIQEHQEYTNSSVTSKLLTVFDTAAAFLWVGPLVSIYWYSTWTLGDRYFFRSDPEASAWLSVAIGLTIITIATLLQDHILLFSSNRCKPARYVLMRVFNYIMSFASVHQWRGVWNLEDYYTGISTKNALITYGGTTALLLLLLGQRSVLYPPTSVTVDVRHADHYKMATFWAFLPSPSVYFLLDTLFTVFLIEPLTISVWRGLWELADCEVYPDDKQSRMIWCLAGSYLIGCVLALLQVPIKRAAAYLEQVNWWLMLALENAITAMYIIFTVISWRGIWLIFEVYASNHTGYLWLYHWTSFLILVAGLSASSAMTQVGPKDGAIPEGRGATLELFYLRGILPVWRAEKSSTAI